MHTFAALNCAPAAADEPSALGAYKSAAPPPPRLPGQKDNRLKRENLYCAGNSRIVHRQKSWIGKAQPAGHWSSWLASVQ